MKFSSQLKKFLFVILLLFPLALAAQDSPKATKSQKKVHQKKEKQIQDAKKAEIQGKKRHMKLQDKKTRNRMKKNKRQGNAYVSRRPGFFQRLFKGFK